MAELELAWVRVSRLPANLFRPGFEGGDSYPCLLSAAHRREGPLSPHPAIARPARRNARLSHRGESNHVGRGVIQGRPPLNKERGRKIRRADQPA